MFAEEKPFLLPLPIEPFRYYQYGERVVHLDGCVEVEAAYYGLPPGWIGRLVKVQWDGFHVRILDPAHPSASARAYAASYEAGIASTMRTTRRKRRSVPYGCWPEPPKPAPHIGQLCNAIHHEQGEPGIRRILGVLSLAKKYGVSAVEDACAAALELGVREYRFVRRYLERRPQLTLRHVDPLIRELTEYRDLINLKTKEQENEPD